MRYWIALCGAVLLAVLLLAAFLGVLGAPSRAYTAPLDSDGLVRPRALPGALRPGQATGAGGAACSTVGSASSSAFTPTTYYTTITPGVPLVMGDTDLILEFAPGAAGLVTVTLVPTMPQPSPPRGALSLTWEITTTATSYEVTATFIYSRAARDADVVLVLDRSGSMEYETLCYGCWEPMVDVPYPDGNIYPLHWSDTTTTTADHCANACEDTDYTIYTTSPTTYYVNDCNYRDTDDEYWTVIEAEEYSRLSVDYHRNHYQPYMSYWVMQRNDYNYDWNENVNAWGRDARGAYLSHHPFFVGTGYLAVNCRLSDVVNGYCNSSVDGGPFPVPQADYDFHAPINDTYYFWIRGQGGGGGGSDHVFWGLGDYTLAVEEDGFLTGPSYDGAAGSRWDWRCLGSESLSEGNHTLKLWAGGAGFDVDRIVVTTDDSGECTSDFSPPGSPHNYPANNGRTDWACNSCDPRFAGRPGGQSPPDPYRPDCPVDLRSDDLYDDEQPMRDVVEAGKGFISDLDLRRDQVGYVRYSTSAEIANELECLGRLGTDNCTPQVISDTVLYELDATRAGGSTNIAGGIMEGIEVLSTEEGHYGRPESARTMVLMTDGIANSTIGCDPACDDEDLWPEGGAAKDCVVYYALQARDQGIVIHTISLGWGADMPLMQEVADITGGRHRWAPSSDKLEAVFDELSASHLLHAPPTSVEAIYHRATPTGTWTLHPLTMTHASSPTWTISGTGIVSLSQWTLGPAMFLSPHHVVLEAAPTTLPAGGVSTATLTATVSDVYSRAVQDGTVVSFTTSLGFVSPPTGTTGGGVATGVFTASTEPGQALVTATAGGRVGTTLIQINRTLYLPVVLHAYP